MQKTPGQGVWISVGSFIEDGNIDAYYGQWPWLSKRSFLRIYMQSGKAINLKGNIQQQPLEALVKWDLWIALQSIWHAMCVIKNWPTENTIDRLVKLLCVEQISNGEVFSLALQRQAWKRVADELKPSFIVIPVSYTHLTLPTKRIV